MSDVENICYPNGEHVYLITYYDGLLLVNDEKNNVVLQRTKVSRKAFTEIKNKIIIKKQEVYL